MKTVFYIILLTLIFSLNIFSQEKIPTIVLPENIVFRTSAKNISIRFRLPWGNLRLKIQGQPLIKQYLDNGFLLIEGIRQTWDGSAWVNSEKYSYTYDGNNNQTEESHQSWDGSCLGEWYKVSYTYDVNNNLTEVLDQGWDGYPG